MARKYGKKTSEKIGWTMREFKRGKLKSGRSGKKVTSREQAIAIGLAQARRAGYKVPPQPRGHATARKAYEPKYGDEPGAFEAGLRYGREAALHETHASARETMRQLSARARTDFDRGQLAGYEQVWPSHSTKKPPAELDREIAEALSCSPSMLHESVRKLGRGGGRSHSTVATRDYEYVVYPEASHRHAERAVKVPMRRVGGALRPYDLADAKRVAKEMGPPAGIYSVSKGRFVGYVHPSGRYVPFR